MINAPKMGLKSLVRAYDIMPEGLMPDPNGPELGLAMVVLLVLLLL